MREIRRVLRPGGGLALLWNGRDLDDPEARVASTSCSLRTAASSPAARSTGARSSARSSSGPGGTRRRLTLAEYVDRVASTSFVGAMAPDRRREFLDEVREALSDFDEPLELRYLTDVYVCEALGTNPSNGG